MPPTDEKSALDAMNDALGDVLTPAATVTDDSSAGDDNQDDGSPPAGHEEGGENTDTEGATGEGTEGEEGGEGDDGALTRDASGRFVKPGEKPAEGQQQTGQQPAAKKPDPMNDQIPKDLKQETQDRIRSLVSMNRETTTKFDTLQKDFEHIVTGIQATGASPEQYGETLSWLTLFNSNDPTQQTKALELVENVADRLATLLGKERTVTDPLSKHPDLQEQVRLGRTTREIATEVARNRNSQSFRTELTTAASTQQQQQQQQQQELDQARDDLTALEVTLKNSDPQYAAKKAHLVPILKPIFANLPPKQWKQAFQNAYRNVKVTAPVRKGVPTDQPLRAKGGASTGGNGGTGMARQPASGLEALNAALGKFQG